MTQQSIATITELLELSGSSYRIFDMGRKVTKIAKSDFEKVEKAMMPYPYPIQGHACFAIVFWQNSPTKPYIWFVKLPLDERGIINQGSRNHYLAIILEALGSNLGQDPTEKQEELLKENPYNFTPVQYKLASLNAVVKRDLKQPASEYYEHCQLYFAGNIGWQNWQGVGVQGLCDLAARINVVENSQYLVNALPHLPEQVFAPLCSALENQKLPFNIIEILVQYIKEHLSKPEIDVNAIANALRALSANAEHSMVCEVIDDIINSQNLFDLNLMLTISGRCWTALTDQTRLVNFMNKFTANVGQEIFAAVFQDLVALPTVRHPLLQAIRNPQRNEHFTRAIGELFAQVKG